jgi:hypothetical protein
MGEIKHFISRDKRTKKQLKEQISQFVDDGDYIILIVHKNEENTTDIITTLDFEKDRIGVKGIMADAQDIMFRVCPPVTFVGDED